MLKFRQGKKILFCSNYLWQCNSMKVSSAPVWLFRQCECETQNICFQADLVFMRNPKTTSRMVESKRHNSKQLEKKHLISSKSVTSISALILCPAVRSPFLSPALWTDFDLFIMEQKVVLITGCSSGIGLGLAIHLASDPYKTYKGKYYTEWVMCCISILFL